MLYERYEQRIIRLLRRYADQLPDLEDMHQEAVTNAFSHFAGSKHYSIDAHQSCRTRRPRT